MDPTLSPGRSLGLGASDNRLLVVLPPVTLPLLEIPGPPDKDGLAVPIVGLGGGPIEVLFPATVVRGFGMEAEGFRTFEGVPVRGVEVVDGVADSCLVGDFVGDYEKAIRKCTAGDK
jgi:hypothetical protein